MASTVHSILELIVLPNGERSTAKMTSCGMEWSVFCNVVEEEDSFKELVDQVQMLLKEEREAEATLHESTLEILVCCNRGVESNVWSCEAHIGVALLSKGSGPIPLRKERVRNALVKFHSRSYKHLFVIHRSEVASLGQNLEISFEIRHVVGYRSQLIATDFFEPSPLSDACISFHNTPRKVYVSSQYLAIHSSYFAKRLMKTTKHISTSFADHTPTEDEISDLDVISLRSDMTATAFSEEPNVWQQPNDTQCQSAGIAESQMLETDDATFTLDDVELEDFIVLLKAIYPPGIEVTEKTLPSLISTSHQFGVDHIFWRCEDYLLSEQGLSEFDLLKRLEYATTYKMAALQSDCLKRLSTANSVRELLEDPKMENAFSEVRSILLETLLQRLKTDLVHTKDSRTVVQTSNLNKCVDDPPGVVKPVDIPEVLEAARRVSVSKAEQGKRESYENLMALRERLNKEMALRKNYELSLKCTRDFIRQTNSATTSQSSNTATLIPLKPKAQSQPSEPNYALKAVPSIPPHASPMNRDFLQKLVFDTFDASKLEKLKNIAIESGSDGKQMFSMHEVFSDIVLEPYTTMKCVTYSFVCHFYSKLYKEKMIPLLTAHSPPKLDAFPQMLVEGIASAIICGYNFQEQLHKDAFMIHELKVKIEKQLHADFDVLRSNVKAVIESC